MQKIKTLLFLFSESKNDLASSLIYVFYLFRTLFGLLLFYSTVRFAYNGWIQTLYIEPQFFFSFFSWLKPLPDDWMVVSFVVMGVSSLFVTLGVRFRFFLFLFFISFSYIELLDKTNYLNHYYLISLLCFLLFFAPPSARLSLFGFSSFLKNKQTAKRNEKLNEKLNDTDKKNNNDLFVDARYLYFLRIQISLVYFFAGLAKIQSDWLMDAEPLTSWLAILAIDFLPFSLPLPLMMSWGGMLFDLTCPFWMNYRKTRNYFFYVLVGFHLSVFILFPRIGVFSWVMIVSSLLFFTDDKKLNERLRQLITNIFLPSMGIINSFVNSFVQKLNRILNYFSNKNYFKKTEQSSPKFTRFFNNKNNNLLHPLTVYSLSFFLVFQILLPLRHWVYSGSVLWNERGFRFSWRVMLIEKSGHVQFKVIDTKNKVVYKPKNLNHLRPHQEKMMSIQPDMIIDFAHYLRKYYQIPPEQCEIYVDSYVLFNGRKGQAYVNPKKNLLDDNVYENLLMKIY